MARGGQNNNQVVMSSTFSPMEDLSSPFFLHNGDHPRLILVSHPLHGPNYNTWSRAILMALTAKNKRALLMVAFLNLQLTICSMELGINAIAWLIHGS
ncbi:hypothetical protein PVL29_021059 [Vitis rotundifolia]|uniref:Retrotransposon Copia-like N-terminal domain-containing protein n=1 Tax=Vitis rotundifolia TaxID=103349 RepID=A0AA38YYN6_VITRO|nr:hypothetical protein PVL29_021059 [Vitis rotundifolia]